MAGGTWGKKLAVQGWSPTSRSTDGLVTRETQAGFSASWKALWALCFERHRRCREARKKAFKIVKGKTNWISEDGLKRWNCCIWKEKREKTVYPMGFNAGCHPLSGSGAPEGEGPGGRRWQPTLPPLQPPELPPPLLFALLSFAMKDDDVCMRCIDCAS